MSDIKVASPHPTKSGPGTVLDGRFEILSTLGNGSMSVVVSARHLQLRQKVAIKLLRAEYASRPDVVTRFLREARAAASLRNEHVVSVTDVGMLPTGVPYMIMEYLQGTDLAAHLATHGALQVDQAVDYVLQLLEALADAHRAGIVHRDIKPANLRLTTREDGSALIKVLDFGVSKLTGPEYTAQGLTMHSPLLGSPAYMSPEQIKNPSDVDARTDIWSVGVVLYELVTGHLPFSGRSAADLITSICSPVPTPISGLISRAPIELVGVIGRCLDKNQDRRYASVQELARALSPFVRTAAAQVSLDRVVGMASAALPVFADMEPPAAPPALSEDFLPPHAERRYRMGRRVVTSLLAVLTACSVGWGVAASMDHARAPTAMAPVRPAGVAQGASALCPDPRKLTVAAAERARSTRLEGMPPHGALAASFADTASRAPGPRRIGRGARGREEAVIEPLPAAAAEPTLAIPSAPVSIPGDRPLDPVNPYAGKR